MTAKLVACVEQISRTDFNGKAEISVLERFPCIVFKNEGMVAVHGILYPLDRYHGGKDEARQHPGKQHALPQVRYEKGGFVLRFQSLFRHDLRKSNAFFAGALLYLIKGSDLHS